MAKISAALVSKNYNRPGITLGQISLYVSQSVVSQSIRLFFHKLTYASGKHLKLFLHQKNSLCGRILGQIAERSKLRHIFTCWRGKQEVVRCASSPSGNHTDGGIFPEADHRPENRPKSGPHFRYQNQSLISGTRMLANTDAVVLHNKRNQAKILIKWRNLQTKFLYLFGKNCWTWIDK